ncbi:RNA-binding protein, partial [Pseudomonas aeruginosa]
LKKHFARQRPTLALDSEASGLVVFSQQHGVLRKLVDDGARLEQEYLVEVAGDLDQVFLLQPCTVVHQLAQYAVLLAEHHQPGSLAVQREGGTLAGEVFL